MSGTSTTDHTIETVHVTLAAALADSYFMGPGLSGRSQGRP